MSDRPHDPDLTALQDDYDITGELGGGVEPTRRYLARRRSDGRDVVIRLAHMVAGGENNALSHFAADVQMLVCLAHENLSPVLEGRWLDDETFAVVGARERGATLAELMARGERFTNPRIGALLETVDGLLDWARGNGVVHRGVTPRSLVLEEGSGRAWVEFEPTPIGMEGVPGAEADARTIARLAWAMLTGQVASMDELASPLAELRPDLSKRVVAETEATMRATSPHGAADAAPVDVAAFIGVIAMGDALKAGEDNAAQLEAEHREQQRIEREQWAEELASCRRQAADDAQRLADDRAAFERQSAEERAAFEKQMADERAALAKQMTDERAAFEQQITDERAAFTRRMTDAHAKFDREVKQARDRLNAARGRLTADRARIAKARAELAQQFAAAAAAPPLPSDDLEDLDISVLAAEPERTIDDQEDADLVPPAPTRAPATAAPTSAVPPTERSSLLPVARHADVPIRADITDKASGTGSSARNAGRTPRALPPIPPIVLPGGSRATPVPPPSRGPAWVAPVSGVVVGLILILAVAFGIERHNRDAAQRIAATAPDSAPHAAAGRLDSTMAQRAPDSVATAAVRPDSIRPPIAPAAAAADSSGRSVGSGGIAPDSAAKSDSARAAEARREERERQREHDAEVARAAHAAAQRDSIARAEGSRNTLDTVAIRHDTIFVRRDTTRVRPDSVRPDTIPTPRPR